MAIRIPAFRKGVINDPLCQNMGRHCRKGSMEYVEVRAPGSKNPLGASTDETPPPI